MSNVAKSEANSEFSEILQLLSTIYSKFRENNKIANQAYSQERFIRMKRNVQTNIRFVVKNDYKDTHLSIFRFAKADLHKK
jgi:hypothetical protein